MVKQTKLGSACILVMTTTCRLKIMSISHRLRMTLMVLMRKVLTYGINDGRKRSVRFAKVFYHLTQAKKLAAG